MPLLRLDIYRELLSEAGFLWTQWTQDLAAPDYTLDDVARGDEPRLAAALDGLVVGGASVRKRLLLPLVEAGEDTEGMVAASWALLAAEDVGGGGGANGKPEDVLGALLDGIEEASLERQAALEWALVLGPAGPVRAALGRLLRNPEPSVQAMALRVLGARSELLDGAAVLEPFVFGERPQTLTAALRALPPVIEPRHRARIDDLTRTGEPASRNAALEVGTLLGLPGARRVAYDLTESKDETAGLALLLLALTAPPADIGVVARAVAAPALRREALWALGFAGTRQAAEAALAWVSDDDLGRQAAEAFGIITGLDVVKERLVRPPPEDADSEWQPLRRQVGESELAYKPDQQLPLADGEGVEDWWSKRENAFPHGGRFREGMPLEPGAVWTALEKGPCRRRPVHALEAAILAHGRALVSTRRWTADQRAQAQRARQEAGRR